MDAFFSDILSNFWLDSAPVTCEAFGSGHVNKTYLVVTETGHRYTLQMIGPAFKDVHALQDNIAAVTEHLHSKTQGIINRAHRATALTEKGYTASVNEAFSKLLSPECGYYESPKRPDACDTIAFIKSIGAVAILCHPFLNLTEAELLAFLPLAKKAGLDAMETVYSTYDEATTQRAKSIAKEFGLLESGGSDFHGANKPDISVGKGRGNLVIPMEFLEKMREN